MNAVSAEPKALESSISARQRGRQPAWAELTLLAVSALGAPIGPAGSMKDAQRCAHRMFSSEQQLDGVETATLAFLAREICTEIPQCNKCPVKRFCDVGRQQVLRPKAKVPMIDLFCGAGGLSIGLEQNGFAPVLALDADRAATATYAFNRPWLSEEAIFTGSLHEALSLPQFTSAPVVVGGPPCQGFSNANRQRLSADPRNTLYKEFITALKQSDAHIALMENVPGMAKATATMVEDFADIGFMIHAVTINARDFGFPQNRNRLFMLCIRTTSATSFGELAATFSRELRNHLTLERRKGIFTLADAISDLPPLEPKRVRNATYLEEERTGFTISRRPQPPSVANKYVNRLQDPLSPLLFNHRSKYNNDRDIEIFSRLLPGEKSDASSIADIMPYKARSHIFKDKFYRLRWDEPCKTITAHMYYDCHMYIHPDQSRGLSPREAARVQGFPDDYMFLGAPNEWYRQIGNAVSPLVAQSVGAALFSVVETMGLA